MGDLFPKLLESTLLMEARAVIDIVALEAAVLGGCQGKPHLLPQLGQDFRCHIEIAQFGSGVLGTGPWQFSQPLPVKWGVFSSDRYPLAYG